MGVFDDDPRTRRLKADFEAMKRLREMSSIMDFTASGEPPEKYVVTFKGKSVKRTAEDKPIEYVETHRVEIVLGIDYPRSQPYLKWLTELYHPNIAISGAVCLGGYSTNWVPSLSLDHLCEMLWDMLRFANYDVSSPYNYRAAQWAKSQTECEFPLDKRSLRDRPAPVQGSNVIKLEFTPKNPPPLAPVPKTDDILFVDGTEPAPQPPPAPVVPRPPAPPPRRPPPGGEDGISFVE